MDYDLRWHVAIDLTPEEAHTCQKTLHNFRAKLMESEKGKLLFEQMTGKIIRSTFQEGKRCQEPFAGTAQGVLRTNGSWHRFPRGQSRSSRVPPFDGLTTPLHRTAS